MLFWTLLTAHAAEVNNPGATRIPFIKLRSADWDIVIRKTADTRARLERVKARCGDTWIDACVSTVEAPMRKHAITQVFKDGVTLSGDFSYCTTAVLRDLPVNLGRDLVDPSPAKFCAAFADTNVARLPTNATPGNDDLVNRLMGGQNTTSGTVRIKPPPVRPGLEPTEPVPEPAPGTPSDPPQPAPTAPAPAPEPAPTPEPAPAPEPEPIPSDPEPMPPGPEPTPPAPEPTTPAPEPTTPAPEPTPEPTPEPEPEPMVAAVTPSPSPKPATKPEPKPATKPEPAASPKPAPEPEPAPPPKPVPAPAPPPPSEFDLEQQELESMERLSDRPEEEEDPKKSKKPKKNKDDPPPPAPVVVGGDDDFDAYIIIDIEGLPDE